MTRRGFIIGTAATAVAMTAADLATSPISASAAEPSWGHPLREYGVISSGFGDTNERQNPHQGIDFWNNRPGSEDGDPIYAIADGVIDPATGWAESYGNLVTVNHGGGWKSLYLHTDSGTHLAIGSPVSRGQKIANIGGSYRSNQSVGPHLHLEIKYNGSNLDPAPKVMSAPLPGNAGDDVPIHHTAAAAYSQPLPANVFTRLRFSAASYDMAAGAGGVGLYDITAHIYLSGLDESSAVELTYALENASTGATSAWYSATYRGMPNGMETRIEFSTKVRVSSGQRLFIQAKPTVAATQVRLAKSSLNYNTI